MRQQFARHQRTWHAHRAIIAAVLAMSCACKTVRDGSELAGTKAGSNTEKTGGNLLGDQSGSSGGSMPPSSGEGGQSGPPEECAPIVFGPQYRAQIAAGNPYLATAEANYIPFKGGLARVSYNTVSVQLRDIIVGQIAPVATDSSTAQTILAGADYAMRESVGLGRSPESMGRSGGGSEANGTAADGADILYIAGIGFPSKARGLGGFEWRRSGGTAQGDTVLVSSPGSASNTVLVFEPSRSITGYSKIREIRSAQGVVTKYKYLSQWDVVIETTHPKKGSILTKYTQQPTDSIRQIVVVKTIEIGRTSIEQAKYTFEMRPGVLTYSLAKYEDLQTSQEYEAIFGARGDIPQQYASRAHADLDPINQITIPSFDGFRKNSSFGGLEIRGSAGAYQQSPGTTPFFTISATEIAIAGRQYLTGGTGFEDAFVTMKNTSSFLDYTNPRASDALRIREFPDDWQQRTQNRPAANTSAGIKTKYEYNDVGAVTVVRNIFSSGAKWESLFTRDAYWLKSASIYDGTTMNIIGDPRYPSQVIMKTAIGTYTARLQWQEYVQDNLTQMLLTNYSETAPNGVTSSVSLSWDNDTLASVTDNNGLTTAFNDTSVAMYDAAGLEMVQTQMESTFASYRAALPTGFSFTAVLDQGVLSRLAALNGVTLSQSKTNLGEATSTPDSFTTRSVTGTESNAAGDLATTSKETSLTTTTVSSTGPRGDFLASSSNGSGQSLAGTCPQVTINGLTTTPGACSQTFVTEKRANPVYAAPALGIESYRIIKKDGKYFLILSTSLNAADDAAVLVIASPALDKAGKTPELKLFTPLPLRQCFNDILTLDSVQKAFGLRCVAGRTGDAKNTEGWPAAPLETQCEISREDACPSNGILTVVLAAGVLGKSIDDETLPQFRSPPLFVEAENYYTNGFQGKFSNIVQVIPDPTLCD
jgi:hypothetical protein